MGKQRRTGEGVPAHQFLNQIKKFLNIGCNVAMPSIPDAGSEGNVSCSPVKSFYHLFAISSFCFQIETNKDNTTNTETEAQVPLKWLRLVHPFLPSFLPSFHF
jgi:hypothetical protein